MEKEKKKTAKKKRAKVVTHSQMSKDAFKETHTHTKKKTTKNSSLKHQESLSKKY